MFLRALKVARPLALAAGCLLTPAWSTRKPSSSAARLPARRRTAVNEARVAGGTADEQGDATIDWTLPAGRDGRAHLVDICGTPIGSG
jgi:hypothetical protein